MIGIDSSFEGRNVPTQWQPRPEQRERQRKVQGTMNSGWIQFDPKLADGEKPTLI